MEHNWFWNIAYFDEPYFHGIFDNFVFPDGTEPQWESVSWLQKRFMKWFNKERLKKVLTFPVETLNMLNDGEKYVDQEWFEFATEMYAEGHSFFTYTSDSVDSLASCCFAGDEECYVQAKDGVYKTSFKYLYDEKYEENEGKFLVPYHGKWKKATLIRLPARQMFKITLDTGDEIKATDNHLFPTADPTTGENNEKQVVDLKVGDYLLYDKNFLPFWNSQWDVDPVNAFSRIMYVEPCPYDEEYVYCFEMEDQVEPYFTLANGVVTHNCRLRNELQDNSFSYTLGAGGVATGSKGVITININRLVQNATKAGRDVSEAVTEQVGKVHKYLLAWNEILKDYCKDKILPVYDAGFISMNKQFLTVGVNGVVEGAEFLGVQPRDTDEYAAYAEMILKPIYDLNKAEKTTEVMFNCEFVPRMSGHMAA